MKQLIKNVTPAPLLKAARSGLNGLGPRLGRIPRAARIFAAPDKQVFFGYYDISPFRHDNALLLATQAPAANVSPHDTNAALDIGYYDLNEKDPAFKKFAETATWNWQQGCRLQWLGTTGNVIYNSAEGAIISNLETPVKTIPFPVYAVSNDGAQALTLDFRALHENRRGYGYHNAASWDNNIHCINLETLEMKIVLSLEQVVNHAPLNGMQGAKHYLNHLSFSPSGQKFMVTHLWGTADGRRHSRLLVCDMNGNIYCPNNNGHTSHYAWINDDKIIIFGSHPTARNRYYLYDLNAKTHQMIVPTLNEDGHPTVLGNIMITDTYPDHFRLQHLMQYDMNAGKLKTLAKFHMPPEFTGEMRCDLHPRPSPDGSLVCVDMVKDNRRAMCVVKMR